MSNIDLFVQISCILSFIGSFLIILTWAFPAENRKRNGRILLFWLSLTDLASSVTYFLHTIHFTDSEMFCQVTSVLGIFWPVASFLWTDCIAFYLYLIVRSHTKPSPITWSHLLKIFHLIVWPTAAAIITLVLIFHHAGSDESDDGKDSNTGGWCWIKADNETERFLWEVIGGKFIEWVSCLLILPLFYTLVFWKLYKIDQCYAHNSVKFKYEDLTLPHNGRSESDLFSLSHARRDEELLQNLIVPPPTQNFTPGNPFPQTHPPHRDSEQSNVFSDYGRYSSDFDNTSQRSTLIYNPTVNKQPDSVLDQKRIAEYRKFSTDSGYNPELEDLLKDEKISVIDNISEEVDSDFGQIDPNPNQEREPSLTLSQESQNQNTTKRSSFTQMSRLFGPNRIFSAFYTKLAAVPILFLLIRFWGSLRILLAFLAPEQSKGVDGFLHIMQSWFDPSQGFFNAILFVFYTADDRTRLFEAISIGGATFINSIKSCFCCFFSCFGRENERKSSDDGNKLPSSGTGLLEESSSDQENSNYSSKGTSNFHTQRLNSASTGNVHLSSDFDCEDSDRISDFSFDATMAPQFK